MAYQRKMFFDNCSQPSKSEISNLGELIIREIDPEANVSLTIPLEGFLPPVNCIYHNIMHALTRAAGGSLPSPFTSRMTFYPSVQHRLPQLL